MTSDGAFRFAHFALQEFILAKEMVRGIISDPPVLYQQPLSVRGTTELIRFLFQGVYSSVAYQRQLSSEHGPQVAVARLEFRDGNFTMASLSRLYFFECTFRAAIFADADLTECLFERCNMRNADLSRARLQGTVLAEVNLVGASFLGANICGAKLRDADLEGANFEGAIYDSTTEWPPDFDYYTAGVASHKNAVRPRKTPMLFHIPASVKDE
jgi:hypothetical protein